MHTNKQTHDIERSKFNALTDKLKQCARYRFSHEAPHTTECTQTSKRTTQNAANSTHSHKKWDNVLAFLFFILECSPFLLNRSTVALKFLLFLESPGIPENMMMSFSSNQCFGSAWFVSFGKNCPVINRPGIVHCEDTSYSPQWAVDAKSARYAPGARKWGRPIVQMRPCARQWNSLEAQHLTVWTETSKRTTYNATH